MGIAMTSPTDQLPNVVFGKNDQGCLAIQFPFVLNKHLVVLLVAWVERNPFGWCEPPF
jgi:hypothetical protein